MDLADLAWGNVSNWVSGIATVAAVVTALVFSLRSETDQRDERYAAVFAWFLIVGEGPARRGLLYLTNNTNAPVYEWKVRVSWSPSADSTDNELSLDSAEFGLLPPGAHQFKMVQAAESLPLNDAMVRVTLDFTDSSGRLLRRSPRGELQRAKK